MTIDERLEKLVERHEALTYTIELQNLSFDSHLIKLDERLDRIAERHEALSSTMELESRAFDERIDRLTKRHEALAQTVDLASIDLRSTGTLAKEIAGGIRDLVAVVRSHEQRLSSIEGIR